MITFLFVILSILDKLVLLSLLVLSILNRF